MAARRPRHRTPLHALVIVLHVFAGVGIIASSAAIVFGAWIPGWWRPLAIGGATFRIVAFAVFWDGQLRQLIEEGAIGALVSTALLLGAMLCPWAGIVSIKGSNHDATTPTTIANRSNVVSVVSSWFKLLRSA